MTRTGAPLSTVMECLSNAGAQIANSDADLVFFFEAEGTDAVTNPAVAFTQDSVVRVYKPPETASERQVLGFRVFTGQPAGRDEEPPKLAGDNSPATFVAYFADVTRGQDAMALRCLRQFVDAASGVD